MMPSGFTANQDGINDTFGPVFEGLKNIKMAIYDTWGNQIYSENGDTLIGWNGTINGIPAENGNYYYKVSGVTFYGETIYENGPFVLIK